MKSPPISGARSAGIRGLATQSTDAFFSTLVTAPRRSGRRRPPPLVNKNLTLAVRTGGDRGRRKADFARDLGRLPWMNSLLIKRRRFSPVSVLFPFGVDNARNLARIRSVLTVVQETGDLRLQ